MKRFKVLGFYRESCYARGRFCKRYGKDEIVAAVPGTLGIMTFKSPNEARNFRVARSHKCGMTVAVEPIGRGKVPKQISRTQEGDIERFYKKPLTSDRSAPPKGTICYPAVLVLE